MPKPINVMINDYANAKDGSLLIKKNGVWRTTTFEELNKENANQLKEIGTIKGEINNIKEYTRHFKIYSISHFLVIFNNFKLKVLNGEIDVKDDEILTLDNKVIQKEISVEDALNENEYLKTTFESVFNNKETIVFPEV